MFGDEFDEWKFKLTDVVALLCLAAAIGFVIAIVKAVWLAP